MSVSNYDTNTTILEISNDEEESTAKGKIKIKSPGFSILYIPFIVDMNRNVTLFIVYQQYFRG